MYLGDLIRPLERWDFLDPLGDWLGSKVNAVVSTGAVKSALNGTWLGHPLHPLLTDIPLGLLTSATVVDLWGGDGAAPAADALTTLGLLAVVPTAAAGLVDWTDSVGPDRRLGLVHAITNLGGSLMYLAGTVSRRGGNRGAARLFSLAGLAVLGGGGYVGGHLIYARGMGVDHTVFDEPPADWTTVARQADLASDTPQLVHANGYGVLLYSHAGTIHAIADRCSHAGGPLHEGEVDEALCVTCPWHASRFRLADGSIVRGPATAEQPSFEVRVAEGNVEVRVRPR
jgi:nitrite reductase/ring-hydroxylating ferredoxin subunit/uncharacterized membrane protein